MKRINYLTFIMLLGLSVIFTGCDDEETPPPNITITNPAGDSNDIPNGIISYDYSITVKGVCTCGPCKTEGLTGATVILNGETKTTDASGIVTFNNLNSGTVSFFVQKAGFAAMNFTALLSDAIDTDVDQRRSAATSVSLFKMDAKVTGRIKADYDNNPSTNTPADNYTKTPGLTIPVILIIDQAPGGSAAYNTKFNGISAGDAGSIVSANFSESQFRFTDNLDNSARYEFDNVPSILIPGSNTSNGGSGFQARLTIPVVRDITANPSFRIFLPQFPISGVSIDCDTQVPDGAVAIVAP